MAATGAGSEVTVAIRFAAATQHGLVTRQQLLAVGLTSGAIAGRVRRRFLVPVHRGVYGVGHVPAGRDATYLAATLAGGAGSILAGRAAAHLQRLIGGSPPPAEVIVRTDRRIEGVRTRRHRHGPARLYTGIHRVPVLTVPEVLLDLAAEADDRTLARAIGEAQARRGDLLASIEQVLRRRPRARGRIRLQRMVAGDDPRLLSRLEAGFMKLIRAHRLPLPTTNVKNGSYSVDCRWPDQKLTVELDSYRYHATRESWRRDHRRDREARLRGDRMLRLIWEDVFEHPDRTVAELRELLMSGGR